MTQAQWTAVDSYLTDLFVPLDPVLDAVLQATEEAGLPPAQVAPNQGKLLTILARAIGARAILELGTLGGYSTIWMARALPEDGLLITLEANPDYAAIAQANIAKAGLAHIVEIRIGAALDSLPELLADGHGPFDVVFLDADKQNNAEYLAWALQLTHPGSLIIADNVVRNGAVIDANSTDASVQGIRRFHQALAAEPRLSVTSIQTVGSKGYDGFTMALVLPERGTSAGEPVTYP